MNEIQELDGLDSMDSSYVLETPNTKTSYKDYVLGRRRDVNLLLVT